MLILPEWEIEACSVKKQDLFQKRQLHDDNQCNDFSFWPSEDKLNPVTC